jgi:TusA-related sulfurtransferase
VPAKHLDNRDLDPPEPLARILAAIETMNAGEVLCALLCREPIFLLAGLAKRGHPWRGGFEADESTYKVLMRVNAAQGATT